MARKVLSKKTRVVGKRGVEESASQGQAQEPTFDSLTGATLQALHTDFTHYPSSHSVEGISILRACLGTNLLSRALKIFRNMRDEAAAAISLEDVEDTAANPPAEQRAQWAAYHSLTLGTYNAVLAALFRRAAAETSTTTSQDYMDQAWTLFREMETGRRIGGQDVVDRVGHRFTADLLPDESTIAVMARGLVKTMQSDSNIGIEQSGLGDLVATAWRLSLSFEDTLGKAAMDVEEAAAAGEVDGRTVAQRLIAAAIYSGHEMARVALEQAEEALQGSPGFSEETQIDVEDPAEGIPALKPVTTTSKDAESPDEIPLNLSLLQKNLSVVGRARGRMRDNEERQRWLEDGAFEAARERLEASAQSLEALGLKGRGTLQNDQKLQTWMWEWVTKLEAVLKKDIARIKQEAEKHTQHDIPVSRLLQTTIQFEANVIPFLSLLSVRKLALVTVLELMRLQGSGGVADGMKTARALIMIGMAVEEEHYADIIRKNPQIISTHKYANDKVRSKGITDLKTRQEVRKWLASRESEDSFAPWTQTIRARVGSYLVGHLMSVATVKRTAVDRTGEEWEEEHPAMYSSYQYLSGKKLGVIKLNEVVARRLDKDPIRETLHPRVLPMLVKPRLWLKHDDGGYLVHKTSMMRFKDSTEQAIYLRKASENNSLETVMAGLDVLGETPWIINTAVFEVMTEVWNSGEDTAGMPPLLSEDHGSIPRPDNYETDIRARAKYLADTKAARLQLAAVHSQRCDTNYKLEIARAYLGEKFYFPHNVDFRGRAYPIPPLLNHIGNDLCRGVLLFADGKRLGKSGLRWLRIHLANTYGFDKASFDEREQFALDHMADVEDAVKNPLQGSRWWLKADDPWQCLASCHELFKAVHCPDGPENYVSCLPIQQDGTCNGLQHYAALGGDLDGAKQVNLASGDRPSDVYTAVADLVIAAIDAEGKKPDGNPYAALLQGRITRKVVKQTVMTTVYGVTFIGAKAQVVKQLAARGDLTEDQLWNAGTYLAAKILNSIGDLFSGAEKIQNWLTESAKLIAKSIPPERLQYAAKRVARATGRINQHVRENRLEKEQMTSVMWTTPLGLPVVQPYRKQKKRQVSTAVQTLFLTDPRATAEVAPGKQASAFPPNFIHSLDATHMILTALECSDAGLTFASVHDSYWTHACDVETMSELIRDTFVRLHTEPILQKLRAEFIENYGDHQIPILVADQTKDRRARRAANIKKRAEAARAARALATDATQTSETPIAADLASEGEATAEQQEQEEEEEGDDGDRKSKRMPAGAVVVDQETADRLSSDLSTGYFNEDTGEVIIGEAKELDKSSMEAEAAPYERQKLDRSDDLSADGWSKTRFIPLKDILPPLPAKGEFDVNGVKTSKYFFS